MEMNDVSWKIEDTKERILPKPQSKLKSTTTKKKTKDKGNNTNMINTRNAEQSQEHH